MVKHLVAAVVACALASPARADDGGAAPPTPAASYHGAMVAGDAAALAVAAVALSQVDPGGGYRSARWYYLPGALAFAISGPLVHGLHRNRFGAAESAALRIGLPLFGVLAGLAIGGKSCDDGCGDVTFSGEALGGTIGEVAAVVIDNVWLAHEPARATGWTPGIAPLSGGGAALGVTAHF